ncbi:MAG: CHASE2 domain-containing protein, partial [Clostridium sp.]|nr:CHASE2 domain-containing protein [Clostridium sp.]
MRIKSFKFLVLSVLLVLLLTGQGLGLLQAVEYQFQDACYQNGGLISPDIYVIGIDEKTLLQYGRWSDWGREKTAELVALLNEDPDTAPAVIALDIGFYASGDEKTDQALMDAVSKQDNIVTVSYATFGKQIESEQEGHFWVSDRVKTYEIPFEGLREHVSWGFSNVPLDSDGLVRHRIDHFEVNGKTEYSFASEIYRKYMGKLPEKELSYIPFSGYPYDYYGSETAGLS